MAIKDIQYIFYLKYIHIFLDIIGVDLMDESILIIKPFLTKVTLDASKQ